ncbi:uncharacterized protein LOC131147142 [Malania oleifera]|uniref:uncharacterized protein LOC131147142 n=1 Tax=Malania oleifera TaxID=397392 RepID=UPI0025AEBB22|nr:uncharacterized protein LOC131147142 [Malania oleifera]
MILEGTMAHKRPFGGENSHEVACKQPRQSEPINGLASVFDIFPCNDASLKVQTSVEDSPSKYHERRVASDSAGEILNGANKEFETDASGSFSSFLWVDGSIFDEDAKSEAAAYSSLFPEYFECDPRVKALVQPDGFYCLSFTDYPPRKLVSVGPDHQAYVPEWGQQNFQNSSEPSDRSDPCFAFSETSGLTVMDDDGNAEKLIGTCVLPMPYPESTAESCCGGEGEGLRSECGCLDRGSVRCVRQHVGTVRDRLKEKLGQKIFEELGFCDMGEEVAKKWSEKEEQAFNDVVLSNPASLGKNFWDHLSVVFPSRTKKDLVSYYFNVFMLRKRAEQSRFDPLNIDSDNDEWQRSEFGSTEEDDDSGGESQIEQVAPISDPEDHKENCLGDAEEKWINESEVANCRDIHGKQGERYVEDPKEIQVGDSHGDCGFYSDLKLLDIVPSKNSMGCDIHDDLSNCCED